MTTLELAKMCHESAHCAGFEINQRPTVEDCLEVLYDMEAIDEPSWNDMKSLREFYRGLWKHNQ